MKKIVLILIFGYCFMGISDFAQGQVIKVGLGAELRSEPPVGMIGKATYRLDFIHKTLRTSVDMMVIPEFEANLDMHYSFFSNFDINAYGIGGLNIENELGANVGAGLMYGFTERILGFWESKYIIKNKPEADIKIGILLKL